MRWLSDSISQPVVYELGRAEDLSIRRPSLVCRWDDGIGICRPVGQVAEGYLTFNRLYQHSRVAFGNPSYETLSILRRSP
jgi:hypothetical protein